MVQYRPLVSDAFSVAGHVLAGGRFFEGHVLVEDGHVVSIGDGAPPMEPVARGIVLPGLVNSHTHVGDAAVPPPPPELGPSEIFPPPDGYKHRMLAALPEEQLEVGVSVFLDAITAEGVVEHVDFREGGVPGVQLLRRASSAAMSPPRSRVFGRPIRQELDSQEMGILLASVDGIGLSAAMDWPREPFLDVVTAARDYGRPVAFHCSESRREELSRVLDLAPEFLVHMVFGTRRDFQDVAAAGVPIVVCPRSTGKFTKAPPVAEMARAGVRIRVGTDNAMLQGPSVLEEVAYLLSLPENRGTLDPLEALSWTLCPAKGSNTGGDFGVSTGSRDLAVLTFEGSDPIDILRESHSRGAELVMRDGIIWRR
jgi:cytosine/adenosine deaminase-related metal-dependent hydrolase